MDELDRLPPGPDDVLTLHDAELTHLRIEERGRRVRLSMSTSVDRGAHEQPVEIVLDDADFVFFDDATEGGEPPAIFSGGPVARGPCRYGAIAAPVHGVDFVIRAGAMSLTAIRARDLTLTPARAAPVDPMLTEAHGWSPLAEGRLFSRGIVGERLPGPRIEAIDLYPVERLVALTFDEPTEGPRVMRAQYDGIASIRIESASSAERGAGARANLDRRAGTVRLQLDAVGVSVTIGGHDWKQRRTIAAPA